MHMGASSRPGRAAREQDKAVMGDTRALSKTGDLQAQRAFFVRLLQAGLKDNLVPGVRRTSRLLLPAVDPWEEKELGGEASEIQATGESHETQRWLSQSRAAGDAHPDQPVPIRKDEQLGEGLARGRGSRGQPGRKGRGRGEDAAPPEW